MKLARAFVLPFALACTTPRAGQPPPEHTAPEAAAPQAVAKDPLAPLRVQARELIEKQTDLLWGSWTRAAPFELEATYAGTEALFTPQTLALVREAKSSASGNEARALERLELYLVGELVARQVSAQAEALSSARNAASIVMDERTLAWRDLDALLAREPSATARAKLLAGEADVLARLTPLVVAKEEATAKALHSLGLTPLEYATRLREVDADRVRLLANATLDATEALYARTMGELALEVVALPLSRVKRADLPRLLRSASSEAWFPAEKMAPHTTDVLAGFGLSLANLGVKVEKGSEPSRRVRPLCAPVSPPEDVRLSLRPRGGLGELRLAVREASCAAASASVAIDPWELRVLAPAVLAETWANLLEAVTRTPEWLSAQGVPENERKALILGSTARRLQSVRQEAARIIAFVDHQRTPEDDRAQAWKALQTRALGFEISDAEAARWAVEQDELLASADRLRAVLLATQLERRLIEKHGAEWWKSEAAGKDLVSLWRDGGALGVEEIARRMELAPLGPDALVETVNSRLR